MARFELSNHYSISTGILWPERNYTSNYTNYTSNYTNYTSNYTNYTSNYTSGGDTAVRGYT